MQDQLAAIALECHMFAAGRDVDMIWQDDVAGGGLFDGQSTLVIKAL